MIEFNDGALDLPRVKAKAVEAAVLAAREPNEGASAAENEEEIPRIEPADDTTTATAAT